jgi:hypothetical protein
MLGVARAHVARHAPELLDQPIQLQQLDGPPGSPRYAVSVGACLREGPCPHGVADGAPCPIRDCTLRHSLRMLLDRDGNVVELLRDGLRWNE